MEFYGEPLVWAEQEPEVCYLSSEVDSLHIPPYLVPKVHDGVNIHVLTV